MVQFLLYLFETGLCLSVLYLVYYLFLRKETYFNFNRIYLVSIVGLSLIIPLLPVSISVNNSTGLEQPIQEIGKVRSYYADFISWADSDISFRQYRDYQRAVFENNDLYDYGDSPATQSGQTDQKAISGGLELESAHYNTPLTPAKLFILLYGLGVTFFLIRLIYLLFWLRKTIQAYPETKNNDYSLVQLNKPIPPFSFFRYIFVPKDATKLSEFEQILAHEKVHVKQKHSLDLIAAHIISVFQWFNPMAWQLQKAIKITHEYIADSSVVRQGFKLVDYQSLLLSQLISIRSVELVNNFNLLSIKKRITMMTKKKSGVAARLKILIIIPLALVVFFLFSDMTVHSPLFSFSNFQQGKTSNLNGIWKNIDGDKYGALIRFEENQLSILESRNSVNVIDLPVTINKNAMVISGFGPSTTSMKYSLEQGNLKIWWSENDWTVYEKTEYTSSSDAFFPDNLASIHLPVMNQSRILDKPEYVYTIYVYPDKYYVDGISCNQAELEKTIESRIAKFRVIDRPFITTRLYMDEKTEMQHLYMVLETLREMELYKVGYANHPAAGVSKLQYHAAALPMKLPPVNAKMVDEAVVKDRLFKFTASDNLKQIKSKLEDFIIAHPDYIVKFGWQNGSTYGEYLAGIDMTFDVVYSLRDAYAQKKYTLTYAELPDKLQKEVRKEYPMRLMHVNLDEE